MGWFKTKKEKLAAYKEIEQNCLTQIEVIRKENDQYTEKRGSGDIRGRNRKALIIVEDRLNKVRQKIAKLETKLRD
jgi:hypothetical protein